MTTTRTEASVGEVNRTEVIREQLQRQADRLRRRNVTIVWLGRIAVAISFLGTWQAISGPLVDPFWISSPLAVSEQLVEWLGDGTIARNTLATIQAMIGGLLLGSASGIAIGFALGMSDRLAGILEPFIIGLYAIPRLAFAPLLVLWFGIGLESKVVLVAFMVYFMVFYNTYRGVREQRGSELIDIARVLGGNRRQITSTVILPGAAAWIFTGLQMAVPYAMMGAIVAEMVASDRGLGHLVVTATAQFDLAGSFAALIVVAVIGIGLNVFVTWSDKRFGLQHKQTSDTPSL